MSSNQNSIERHIGSAKNLRELLSHDGEEFINCLYHTLLNREPDESGKLYYLTRLLNSEEKLQLILEIEDSDEAKQLGYSFGNLVLPVKNDASNDLNIIEPPNHQAVQLDEPINTTDFKNIPDLVIPETIRLRKYTDTHVTEDPKRTVDLHDINIWFDLTTTLEWKEGVVGIIRAELEIASALSKIDSRVRFSMQIGNGFVEIPKNQLTWLIEAENVVDAYMNFFGRYKTSSNESIKSSASIHNKIDLYIEDTSDLYHPFSENDVVFAMGWMDSRKEIYFQKLKNNIKIYLCYLIYDIILLLEETKHFYHAISSERFENYIKWITFNADYIIFGGNNAKQDTECYQKNKGWPILPGASTRFGTDIVKSLTPAEELNSLREIGITGPFIITVGSIEPRKNHDSLYRAYLYALDNELPMPQLIICGTARWRATDLVDRIDRDPKIAGKILRAIPTDIQLAALYKNCLFTLLPSIYEGWSLTLPESLGQGKFCICTDTPPLREIGVDLVDYVNKWDIKGWAEKISLYAHNNELLKTREEKIADEWTQTTWRDTASMIHAELITLPNQVAATTSGLCTKQNSLSSLNPVIWLDLTLTFLDYQGGVNGIIRTELTYAKYLKKLAPNTRFFAYYDDYFFEILPDYLIWLFDDSDLDESYQNFQTYWKAHESAGTGYRNPFRATLRPVPTHPAYLESFPVNSAILFIGIDSDQYGKQHRTKDILDLVIIKNKIIAIQILFDFTPILYPQYHHLNTCKGYISFVRQISNNFDHIIYGGKTAQKDGKNIQERNGWRQPSSSAISFGSDINTKLASFDKKNKIDSDKSNLSNLLISGDFILVVGTLEPRKNHEMLYKAYLTIKALSNFNVPKLIFAGRKGWNVDDFLDTFNADERIKGQIIWVTPTDDELDALYRNCMFTLLPSFYEGWSLTLPESLSYGKFCLTSAVEPLSEVGRDLVEYINPLDTLAWADRIIFYSTHPEILKEKENYIKKNWLPLSWKDSTEHLINSIYSAHAKITANRIVESV